jgi:hypothetical protein
MSMISFRPLVISFLMVVLCTFGGIVNPMSAYAGESSGIITIEDGLIMSSIIGGTNFDISYEISIDGDGNIIFSGITRSADIPINDSRPSSHIGSTDRVIVKFTPDGGTLLWTTYIGGTGNDEGDGLAISDDGDIYICGETASSDFPVTSGAVQQSNKGSKDVYVARLNGTTGELVFSTYIGGDDFDYADDLVLDINGNPIICGKTDSADFPVTSGVVQESNGGSGDGYVLRLSSDGSTIHHSTFLGDRYVDRFYGVATDSSGSIYLTGLSQSRDFPTTNDAYQSAYAGGNEDVIICKLDSSMSTLEYSTFFGAGFGNTERGRSIKVDSDGSIFIMGETNDDRFPTTASAFQSTYGGDPLDVFVSKFSSDGASLDYSSYLGGGNLDMSNRFIIDSLGNAYVVGVTRSTDFPVSEGALKTSLEGEDVFLCRIGPSGMNLNYSTLFGGSGDDYGYGIDHIDGGLVIISGTSDSADFPLLGGYNQTSIIGSIDMFFSTIETDVVQPHANAGADEVIDQSELFTFKGDGSYDDIRIVNFTWRFEYEGRQIELLGPRPSFTFDIPGIYTVILRVMDAAGNADNDTVNITVLDIINPTADAGRDIVIDQHETVTFNGSSSWDQGGIVNFTWSFVYEDDLVKLFGATTSFVFELAGRYEVTLNVTDRSGNWAMDTVNVTVNDITPPIVLEDLSDTKATTGEDFHIKLRLWDDVGINRSSLGKQWSPVSVDSMGIGLYEAWLVMPLNYLGQLNYSITFKDLYGNEGYYENKTPTIKDNDPPVIDYEHRFEEFAKGGIIPLHVSATDNIGVTEMRLVYWFEESNVTNLTVGNVYYIELQKAPEGDLHLYLSAVDEAGNWASTEEHLVTMVNAVPEILDLPTWNVTEGEVGTFNLGRYVIDSNDPHSKLVVSCSDEVVEVDGMHLTVLHDTAVPDRTVTVTVSDGYDEATMELTIHVINVNDPPVITDLLPVNGSKLKEGKKVTFSVEAEDEEGEDLTVTWKDGEEVLGTGSPLEVKLKPGEHTITVVVDDGIDQVEDSFTVIVKKEEESPGYGTYFALSAVIIACLIAWRRKR